MPQPNPTWQDLFNALVCTGILTYVHLVLGAPRMERLKRLALNLPDDSQARLRTYGPILGGGIRLQFIVLASLLHFLDRIPATTWNLAAQPVRLTNHDLLLLAGAVYLLLRLLGTFSKARTGADPEDPGTPAQFPRLVFYDLFWSLEMATLGLGLADNMAPVLLAALMAHTLLVFYSKNILQRLQKRNFTAIGARLAFLFCVLLIVADATGVPQDTRIFQLCGGAIILVTLLTRKPLTKAPAIDPQASSTRLP